ncbi:MAG: protein kinase [Planctomycetes bacterium]|nr:protein kinase [Planctomycetota bacterium]
MEGRGNRPDRPSPRESAQAPRAAATDRTEVERGETILDAPGPGEPPPPSREFGRFHSIEEIARGGMGVILRAVDAEIGRPVAIKVMLPKAAGSETLERRFLREAQVTGQLQHPGIPPVYELSRTPKGRRYFAMKLIEGRSLADVLAELEKRGPDAGVEARPRLLDAFVKVCDAVAYAHSRGVVHRDLKPANVMLGEFGEVLVMDWGLAGVEGQEIPSDSVELRGDGSAPSREGSDARLTGAGALLGTPAYMSPEQARAAGEPIDERSDIYSLGAVLYEILTLSRPYSGRSADLVLDAVLKGRLEPPSERAPSARVPAELDAVVKKAMSRNRLRRYSRVLDLKADIEAFLQGRTLAAARYSPFQLLAKWLRRHRTVALASAAAVVVLAATLAALGGVWYFTPGELNLVVSPPGARVTIAGETRTAGEEPLVLSLPVGGYELAVEAADHKTETREVMVERGRTKELSISLAHHTGSLDAQVEPESGSLEVDGRPFGSRIPALPFPTGTHVVVARANGHFVRKREVLLGKDGTLPLHFWLDQGLVWEYSSAALHENVQAIEVGDLDKDGTSDVAVGELTRIVYLSGATGQPIGAFAPSGGMKGYSPVDLGGTVGQVLIVRTPDVVCLVPGSGEGGGTILWTWNAFATEGTGSRAMSGFCPAIPDRDSDGVSELLVLEWTGGVHLLSGKTGLESRSFGLIDEGREFESGLVCQYLESSDRLLFAGCLEPPGPRGERLEHVAGLLSLSDGRILWRESFPAEGAGFAQGLGPAAGWGVWAQDGSRWTARDAWTGTQIFETGVDLPGRGRAMCADLDRDGEPREWAIQFPEGGAAGISAVDGRVLWEAHGPGLVHGSGLSVLSGRVLCPFQDALVVLDGATGAELGRWPGRALGALAWDLDGDKRSEILVSLEGEGLLALSLAGDLLWTLHLEGSVRPITVLPDADGDGMAEIVVARGQALVARIRTPRFLWQRRAAGPLLSSPLIADLDGDGALEVVQSGPWFDGRWIQVFEGSSGRSLRGWTEITAPNRSPGLGDWDGDGRPDLAFVARAPEGGFERFLFAARGATGELLARVPLEGTADSYAVPVLADLDGDGATDFATHRWHSKEVLAMSGARNGLLWSFPTEGPNMGGVATADLDLDGRPDVVAPSIDGNVYALSGPDGRLLWKAPIGEGGSRSPPSLADLTGDGVPEVLLVTQQGIVSVLEGRTGESLLAARLPESTEGLGKPAVAHVPGAGTAILAPAGQAGVLALRWETRELLWRTSPGAWVVASPIPCDIDGDGLGEVVAATATGEVIVLDLVTGAELWRVNLSDEMIEGDPAVADLDGDGLAEIVVADHAFQLSAIDGRVLAPALSRPDRGRPRER